MEHVAECSRCHLCSCVATAESNSIIAAAAATDKHNNTTNRHHYIIIVNNNYCNSNSNGSDNNNNTCNGVRDIAIPEPNSLTFFKTKTKKQISSLCVHQHPGEPTSRRRHPLQHKLQLLVAPEHAAPPVQVQGRGRRWWWWWWCVCVGGRV